MAAPKPHLVYLECPEYVGPLATDIIESKIKEALDVSGVVVILEPETRSAGDLLATADKADCGVFLPHRHGSTDKWSEGQAERIGHLQFGRKPVYRLSWEGFHLSLLDEVPDEDILTGTEMREIGTMTTAGPDRSRRGRRRRGGEVD